MTDIAITGLGCRFPGAPDISAYWKLLLSGERQFSAVPKERWNHETFHEPGNPSAPHAAYTDQVAFLEDVDRFDAMHYGVPPARARAMDPQHRLLLDVTREALDDAGLGRGDFDRENTGVFCGMSVSDYKDLMSAPIRAIALAEDAHRAAADPMRPPRRRQGPRGIARHRTGLQPAGEPAQHGPRHRQPATSTWAGPASPSTPPAPARSSPWTRPWPNCARAAAGSPSSAACTSTSPPTA